MYTRAQTGCRIYFDCPPALSLDGAVVPATAGTMVYDSERERLSDAEIAGYTLGTLFAFILTVLLLEIFFRYHRQIFDWLNEHLHPDWVAMIQLACGILVHRLEAWLLRHQTGRYPHAANAGPEGGIVEALSANIPSLSRPPGETGRDSLYPDLSHLHLGKDNEMVELNRWAQGDTPVTPDTRSGPSASSAGGPEVAMNSPSSPVSHFTRSRGRSTAAGLPPVTRPKKGRAPPPPSSPYRTPQSQARVCDHCGVQHEVGRDGQVWCEIALGEHFEHQALVNSRIRRGIEQGVDDTDHSPTAPPMSPLTPQVRLPVLDPGSSVSNPERMTVCRRFAERIGYGRGGEILGRNYELSSSPRNYELFRNPPANPNRRLIPGLPRPLLLDYSVEESFAAFIPGGDMISTPIIPEEDENDEHPQGDS